MVAAAPQPPPETRLGIAALKAMREVRDRYKESMDRYVSNITSGNLPSLGDAYSLSAAFCGLISGLRVLEQIEQEGK